MDNSSNTRNRPAPIPPNIAVVVPKEKSVLEIKKNRIVRVLYMVGGTVSLVLAILGIVVPGLPTTPFALLSAFLYAKSSPKLYNWLLNNRVLGPRIRGYQRRQGVTRKGKIGIIIFMTCMVLFSSFVVIHNLSIRMVILSLGLVGAVVVWFFVPTARVEKPSLSLRTKKDTIRGEDTITEEDAITESEKKRD